MSEGIAEEPVRTGVAEIDEVLDAIDDLDSDDVSSHVAVFERVHETLRRGLEAAPDSN